MAAPETPSKRVAVLGGGIAGLAAAIRLAERGRRVTLYERFDLWGGKLKGWETRVESPARGNGRGTDTVQAVEHGMHGWWRNYHNFKTFLDELPSRPKPRERPRPGFFPVTRFLVVDGVRLGRRPGLRFFRNSWVIHEPMMAVLWGKFSWRGFVDLVRTALTFFAWDLLSLLPVGLTLLSRRLMLLAGRLSRGYRLLFAGLSHGPPEWLDNWSLSRYIEELPTKGRVGQILDLFQSMLTYGSPDRISAYHVARSLDFYGLRNRDAMWFAMCSHSAHYDVVRRMAERARALGVDLRSHTPVRRLERHPEGGFTVHFEATCPSPPETAEYVISALDIPAAQRVLGDLEVAGHGDWQALREGLGELRTSPVMVVRLWLKERLRSLPESMAALAVLRAQEADCPFDFLFFPSVFQADGDTFGEVLEFHLPRAQRFRHHSRRQIVDELLRWARRLFPELMEQADPVAASGLNDVATFSASDAGHLAHSPAVATPLDDLFVCGDWVRLDSPVAYMEKAFVTGVLAAGRVVDGPGGEGTGVVDLAPPNRWQRRARWVTERLDEAPPPEPGATVSRFRGEPARLPGRLTERPRTGRAGAPRRSWRTTDGGAGP